MQSLELFTKQFTLASGDKVHDEFGDSRIELTARSNGDKTYTVVGAFTENRNDPNTFKTAIPEVTIVDGHQTTHQIGDFRFEIFVTADSKRSAVFNQPDQSTFVEGTYQAPVAERYQLGEGYHFERGQCMVMSGGMACVPPFPEPEAGRYHVKNDCLVLHLRDRVRGFQTQVILHHRNVHGVHLLLDADAVAEFDANRKLKISPGKLYVLVSRRDEPNSVSWSELLAKHPAFAQMLPTELRQAHIVPVESGE